MPSMMNCLGTNLDQFMQQRGDRLVLYTRRYLRKCPCSPEQCLRSAAVRTGSRPPREPTPGSHSRVSGNASRRGIRVNRLQLLDLHTECALDPRLVWDCLQGGLDTISTQLLAGARPFREVQPSLSGGMARKAKSVRLSLRTIQIGGDVCTTQAPLEYAEVIERSGYAAGLVG